MNSILPLCFILATALCSCTTSTSEQTSTHESARSGPKLAAKQFRITGKLIDKKDGSVLELPVATTRTGKTVRMVVIRNFKPGDPTTCQVLPVTAASPKSLIDSEVGIQLDLTPKADGSYVSMDGTLLTSSFLGFARGSGEGFAPIKDADGSVVNENIKALPQYERTESKVAVVGTASKEFGIDYKAQNLKLILKCEAL
jgi:hypothetical protein